MERRVILYEQNMYHIVAFFPKFQWPQNYFKLGNLNVQKEIREEQLIFILAILT